MTTFNCDICNADIPTKEPRTWLGIKSGVTNQPVPQTRDESRIDLCESCAKLYGSEALVVDKLRMHFKAQSPIETRGDHGLPQESEEVHEEGKPSS